ncbi:MAG: hypothetical protein ABIB79_03465 [archaeon]
MTFLKIIAIFGGALLLLLLLKKRFKNKQKNYWEGITKDDSGQIISRWVKPKSNPKIKIPLTN